MNREQDSSSECDQESVQRLLDEVLAAADDAFFTLDHQWRLTYVNPKAEQLWGRRRKELMGRGFVDAFPELLDSEPWEKYVHAMRRGEPVRFETWCPLVKGWAEVTACPTPHGLSVHFHDVSRRQRAEQVVRSLAEASAALTQSLDYETTLANVAKLMVPRWADWCMVDLIDGHGGIRNVAVVHMDPEKLELAQSLHRRYPPSLDDDIGSGYVVRTGETQCVPEVNETVLRGVAKDGEHLRILQGLGLRSGVVVPLQARGRTLGAITLIVAESERRFTEMDVPHLTELGCRCGLAIDNARLYDEAQRELAQRKQMEQDLRSSEARERDRAAELEALMDAVPAVIFLAHDTVGRCITGSRTAYEFLRAPVGANLSRSADETERPTHFRVFQNGAETSPDQLPVQRAARGETVNHEEMEVRFDDGTIRYLFGNAIPLRGADGRVRGALAALLDITEHKRVERALRESGDRERVRAAEFEAVVELGQAALAGEALEPLFDRAVTLVTRTLGCEMGKVLELLPGGEHLRLRAGVGWRNGLIGQATVDTGHNSQAGYTLRKAHPVIVENLRTERRFTGPPLLREHDVVSGMSVIIAGHAGEPWGVLGTHTRQHRRFTNDDVNFLQSVANVLADAIARKRAEQGLQQFNETLEQRVVERTAEANERARQLQQMAAELTGVEQRERQKLAQMLHDDHQQLLVGAKMQAGMLKRLDNSASLHQGVEKLMGTLDEAIASSRSLSYELSPPSLYTDGLAAALHTLAERKRSKYGLALHVEADESAEPARETVRVLLFQLVRELLLNIIKHAQVNEAWVRLARDGQSRIVLVVEDHGRGFKPRSSESRGGSQGLGLSGMRERLVLLDGEMDVQSAPGCGTKVTVRVPIGAGAAGGAADEIAGGRLLAKVNRHVAQARAG